MGMCDFREIAYLSKIAEPDFGVVTTIGSSHIETLGSRENICKAKMEIAEGLKENGQLVLCGDEPLLYAYKGSDVAPSFVSVYNNDAEFRAINVRYADNNTYFDVVDNREVVSDFVVPALGLHHVYGALFAYAIGAKLGLDVDEIRDGFTKFKNAAMRQSIYDIGGVKVIDACYNASPESMRASLEVLCELSRQGGGARKMALLGDMRELGQETRALHEGLGAFVAEKKLDRLFTYGVAASFIASSAKDNGMKEEYIHDNPDVTDPLASGKAILDVIKPGDIILFKASRAMAAEKILAYLRENENNIRG
jgi:UDP-N-acetylmuramoyl-tripeptide--D-alanyl-D-alanine ligase